MFVMPVTRTHRHAYNGHARDLSRAFDRLSFPLCDACAVRLDCPVPRRHSVGFVKQCLNGCSACSTLFAEFVHTLSIQLRKAEPGER